MALLTNVNLMLKKERYNFLCETSSSPEGYGLGFPKGVGMPKIIPHAGARCELPEDECVNFIGPIEYVPLKPGKKYYRCVGVGSVPAGAYWTDVPIRTIDQVRLELAIKHEWNGDHGVVSLTPTKSIAAWRGKVAPQRETDQKQRETDQKKNHYLPGGGVQYWVDTKELTDGCGSWEIFELPEVSRAVSLL